MAGGFSTVGLRTIKARTVTINDGATSAVVTHGWGRAPTIAHLPGAEQGLNCYYSGKGVTQYTLNIQSPAVGNVNIDIIEV